MSAMQPLRIFITGATGYIGGSVASALLSRGYEVRGLERGEHAAKQLEAMKIEPVLGSLDDGDVLRRGESQVFRIGRLMDSYGD